jgi:isopenicillin-N N-acyltransferase-like protein
VSQLLIARAEGDPSTRGRTIGKTFRDLIQRSIEFYHRYFDGRGVTSPELQDLLTPHLAAAEAITPELMAMITGMAEGAMVPVMELFAVNAFEELEPLLSPVDGQELFLDRKEGHRVERCSSFSSAGDGYTLLGHNEQWLAGDLGNVGIVLEIPGDGQASIASATNVCCLPSVGMNSHGEAQGIASLTASDDRPGIPRVLESRYTFDASSKDDAIRRAGMEHRSGGYGHVFAFNGGDAMRRARGASAATSAWSSCSTSGRPRPPKR